MLLCEACFERDGVAAWLPDIYNVPILLHQRKPSLARLTTAIGRHTAEVFQEYNLARTRGLAVGRFLRCFERGNTTGQEAAHAPMRTNGTGSRKPRKVA
jgi:hypothetical protein